jgi:N-acylglucosamine 2-epimerase
MHSDLSIILLLKWINQESADLELNKLHEFYHAEIFNRFIPNMDKYVIDHQLGGFMTSIDITNGKQANSNKTAWFEGRGMWTYSFLYNNLEKNPKYLEVARKSKDFILKHLPKDDKFFTSSYSNDGKPLSGPGDIYSSLFVAEGLAEFAKASGDKQYFTIAKKIILSCLARYDSPDYDYYVAYLNPGATKIPGPRVLGHWMVFLRAATQILENGPDADMEKLADRCLDACLNHHLNPQYQLFNEVLNHDFSRPDNSYKDFSYTGHGIEMCWMLHFEAARRKDKKLFDRITEIFKRHVSVAHDDVYGGYFRALDHVDNNIWKVDKVLWLQEEVLIGSMFIAEHTGENGQNNYLTKPLNMFGKVLSSPAIYSGLRPATVL